jgi:hypothetical protein
MKLKVITGITAKKLKDPQDRGFIMLAAGEYPIRPVEDGKFEITKSKGVVCYLSSEKLEEKMNQKAIIIITD